LAFGSDLYFDLANQEPPPTLPNNTSHLPDRFTGDSLGKMLAQGRGKRAVAGEPLHHERLFIVLPRPEGKVALLALCPFLNHGLPGEVRAVYRLVKQDGGHVRELGSHQIPYFCPESDLFIGLARLVLLPCPEGRDAVVVGTAAGVK
jgi:hypothetical protein